MRRKSRGASRRGFSLMEVGAASALLAVALTLTVQFVHQAALAERNASRRSRALAIAHQRLERAAARAYDDLSTEALGDLALTPGEQAAIGGGTIEIRVTPQPPESDPAEIAAKRIEVAVATRDARGAPGAVVRLATWVYAPGASPPEAAP